MSRFQLAGELPAPLPVELARELASTPLGVPVVWRPRAEIDAVLGCTRYLLGDDHGLLIMREITERQRALSHQLHQQRLRDTGRFAALMAHDLRTPLSSIVYNVDLLQTRAGELPSPTARELLRETWIAADQMRRTIAGLLDFVRLGPPVSGATTMREVFERVSSLLRPVFRSGGHALHLALHDPSTRLRGNPLIIEQIFVNLLVNATEAVDRPVFIYLASEHVPAAPRGQQRWRAVDDMVRVRIADNGPGIPPELIDAVFEPFITSKPHGTGLGLTTARDAARSLGGDLVLVPATAGCTIEVVLPVARTDAHTEENAE